MASPSGDCGPRQRWNRSVEQVAYAPVCVAKQPAATAVWAL
jgi:hypothetical protein